MISRYYRAVASTAFNVPGHYQLLLMAAAVLLFQVIFIAMVLFAPVPLLLALVPAWQSKAFDWAMKTLHALLMKIGFALLMTVMFTISKILYNAVDQTEYGYLFVLGMQILCFVGIWLKRKGAEKPVVFPFLIYQFRSFGVAPVNPQFES